MRYVIAGNSAAAVGAVEGIRSVDPDGEVIIVSPEKWQAYSRPLISYYLAGKVTEENMFYRSPDFYEKYRVKTYLGEEITALSVDCKTIHLEPSGKDLQYDRLLIATGGVPVELACFQGKYKNLFNFHQWDDVDEIAEALSGKIKAVIVGGGLIGLKAAESLRVRGLEVTVIEAAPYLLSSILDEKAAEMVRRHLLDQGIEIILANPVTQVEGKDTIEGLVLKDGRELNCDMVIMAAGMKPNVKWLGNQGIDTQSGVLVNGFLQSSLADIFAAGDVAETYSGLSSSYRLVPIWPFAYRQGKVAGQNMAGIPMEYNSEPAFNSIPLMGLNIATAGLSSAGNESLDYIKKTKGEWEYKKLVLQDDKLLGFIFIGDIARSGIYRFLIEKNINVAAFKERLLDPGFGMIDLPASYREQL